MTNVIKLEGQIAYASGKMRNDCPYLEKEKADFWLQGWESELKDRQNNYHFKAEQ